MSAKIPLDAFQYYLSLGPARSYEAVAERYDVTKRAIVNCAAREHWQERAAEIERKARREGDERAAETIAGMNERHLKILRLVQGRAIEALRTMSLSNPLHVLRALDMSIRREQAIRAGEDTARVEDEAFEKAERIRRFVAAAMLTVGYPPAEERWEDDAGLDSEPDGDSA